MHVSKMRTCLAALTAILAVSVCPGLSMASPVPSDHALMQESFQQFDQNLNSGWRLLQVRRDYLGAAHAMLEYLSVHSATLKLWQKDSLAFHLGHVYALVGQGQQASHWFRKSLTGHLLGNPAYVKGFIAFLQNDKPALLVDRHKIEAMRPSLTRVEDLSEMDAMIEYFGEPFEAAWGALNCHNPAAESTTAAWIAYCGAIDAKYRKLFLQHGIKLRSE